MDDQTQLIRSFLANLGRYVLLPLAFVGLVLIIVWFFFWRSPDQPAKKLGGKNDSSQSSRSEKANEKDKATKSDDEGSTSSDSTTEPSTSSTSTSRDGTSTTPAAPGGATDTQKLADSGPGEVLVLFLAVFGIAAGSRYFFIYRKLNQVSE